jgi:vacuolar-type H+-ATPase subunit E/Vma4
VKVVDNESVDKICSQIEEDGDKEIESILEKAKRTAAEIVGKAEKESGKISDKILTEAREKGELTRRRLLSSVKLEVKRARLRTREDVVTNVYDKVKEAIGGCRDRKDYAGILASLTTQAVRALDGDTFTVYADGTDLALLESDVLPLVREMTVKEGRRIAGFEVEALPERSLGGVQVGVPGGNVIYDNTFEARMYRLRDRIRNIIFDEVFSSDTSEESGSA